MSDDSIVVVGGPHASIGRLGGLLRDIEASDLAGVATAAALEPVCVAPADVDEVTMGQVGQVGAHACNARCCAISAGIPVETTAMNVTRLCASGLQAGPPAAGQLQLGEATVVVAGGNESMSRQPFVDYDARAGWRLGSRELGDGTPSLVKDPFGRYMMGETAERAAERYGVAGNVEAFVAALGRDISCLIRWPGRVRGGSGWCNACPQDKSP
jgi:acetyl-CoA C-acetyltransferase